MARNIGRIALCAAALVLAPVDGFAPATAPLGAGCARALTVAGGARPRALVASRPAATARCAGGVLGLRASSEEVDLEAFRDLLNDSWATDRAKSDDGVGAVPACCWRGPHARPRACGVGGGERR